MLDRMLIGNPLMRLYRCTIARRAAFTILVSLRSSVHISSCLCYRVLLQFIRSHVEGITLYSDEPIPPEPAGRILAEVQDSPRLPIGRPFDNEGPSGLHLQPPVAIRELIRPGLGCICAITCCRLSLGKQRNQRRRVPEPGLQPSQLEAEILRLNLAARRECMISTDCSPGTRACRNRFAS